jgi:hypothetical protein
MALRKRSMLLSGLVSVFSMLAVQSITARQSGLPSITPSVPEPLSEHALVSLAGQWIYNADESINVATGRPEQAPRSATQRTPGARAGGAGGGAARPTGLIPRSAGTAESTSDGSGSPRPGRIFTAGEIGPTLAMMQESRSLRRDLMEVPEALTISVASGVVSFTDDLERTRAYETSGLKQKYQLGAARFAASTEWKNSQLQKYIEASDGFRMTETYFLSSDGRRMFVIVRLGDQKKKGAPLVGVNRVYDRAN